MTGEERFSCSIFEIATVYFRVKIFYLRFLSSENQWSFSEFESTISLCREKGSLTILRARSCFGIDFEERVESDEIKSDHQAPERGSLSPISKVDWQVCSQKDQGA